MGILDRFRNSILNWLLPVDDGYIHRRDKYARLRDYYEGDHKRQMKVKPLQADDNLITNFISVIVERGISMLFGEGVTFELPNEADDAYIEEVINANKPAILFHKLGQYGSIYGTTFLRIMPDGLKPGVPRLVALDPSWMTIETDPEDIETVTLYRSLYNIVRDGREIARKEEVERVEVPDGDYIWNVVNYEASVQTNGRWVETSRVEWPYPFPPIIHWQNLPQADNVYGQSDIEDVLEVQDRYNFVMSNVSRIIRYHAHPKTWMRGGNLQGQASWGADEMITLMGENAEIKNLEMQSDLASSITYVGILRQSLFDIARSVDITSLKDKIGALTNFGIRVLYTDAMAKVHTKQELYGEGLLELCRRLLALKDGRDYWNIDVGAIHWGDPLPKDEVELINRAKAQLEMGIVSKQTVSSDFGLDWELEQERMQGEEVAGDNVGAALLRAFERGQ